MPPRSKRHLVPAMLALAFAASLVYVVAGAAPPDGTDLSAQACESASDGSATTTSGPDATTKTDPDGAGDDVGSGRGRRSPRLNSAADNDPTTTSSAPQSTTTATAPGGETSTTTAPGGTTTTTDPDSTTTTGPSSSTTTTAPQTTTTTVPDTTTTEPDTTTTEPEPSTTTTEPDTTTTTEPDTTTTTEPEPSTTTTEPDTTTTTEPDSTTSTTGEPSTTTTTPVGVTTTTRPGGTTTTTTPDTEPCPSTTTTTAQATTTTTSQATTTTSRPSSGPILGGNPGPAGSPSREGTDPAPAGPDGTYNGMPLPAFERQEPVPDQDLSAWVPPVFEEIAKPAPVVAQTVDDSPAPAERASSRPKRQRPRGGRSQAPAEDSATAMPPLTGRQPLPSRTAIGSLPDRPDYPLPDGATSEVALGGLPAADAGLPNRRGPVLASTILVLLGWISHSVIAWHRRPAYDPA